jgi:Ca2+-binding RTX toxin-like protein
VNVNLGTGKASGDGADTLISIEDVIGSDGDDIIVGSTADNELTGGLGDDNLSGGGGADILFAGTGDDTVDAGDGDDIIIGGDGAGNDKYIGGAGTDTVKYTSATAAITVDLAKGTATSTSGKDAAKIGTDTLSGIENVIAGNYNDIVKGNTGSNVLTGGLGTDSLYGGADKVKDVFDFNAITESKTGTARDKVYDFLQGTDDLDLQTMDANTKASGDQAFKFAGTKVAANSVWYAAKEVDGSTATKDIIVYGDVNGDGKADFEIGLVGVTSLTSADFVL